MQPCWLSGARGIEMIRFLSFLIALLIGLLSAQIFASEHESDFRYLKDPQLKWEGERLTGELKNVPVKTLLEELSRKEGFQLEIVGDLDQKVDISFDHLTLEQCIKKIMRLTNLSHVIISDVEGQPEDKALYRLNKLIVCQKGEKSRSSRTHHTPPAQKKRRVEKKPAPDEEEAISSPPESSGAPRQRPKATPRKSEVEFEGSPEDLKGYVEEMSQEGRINSEEYKMILEKIGGGKR